MIRRIAVATFAVLLVVPFVFVGGASASGPKVVREAIVSQLGPDGAVQETTVAQLIHLEAAPGGDVELRVPKVEELESYRNLSGFRGTSGEDDDIVWKTSDKLDARSLSRFEGKLPLNIRVKYFLDDKEISPNDIKRQQGDVRIEIELENTSGESKNLEHKAVTSPFLTSFVNQYVPLEYAVRVEFPTDRWEDVGGSDVRVAADGNNEIASASGILSPPLTAATKTIAFEGKSEDILTPRVQVFAVPGLSDDFVDALQEQYDALQALYAGTGVINENLSAVYEGTVELVNGVEDLIAGVGANDATTGKPVIELDDNGLPTSLLGTLGFLSEAVGGQILPGIGEVGEDGKGVIVKDEDGKTTTLLGGLQSQKETYDDKLIPGMEQLIDGMDQLIAGVEDGAPALVAGLGDLQGGVELLLGSLQSGNFSDPGFFEGLQLASGGLSQLLAGLGNTADPANSVTVIGSLKTMADGLTQLVAGLGNTADPANTVTVIGSLKTMSDGVTALLGALQSQIGPLAASLEADVVSANTLYGASDPLLFGTMVAKAGQLAGALSNAGPVVTGAQQIAGGITLLLGSLQTDSQVTPGFREGMLQLSGGIAQLLGSLQTDSQVTPGFREGLQQVKGGVDALAAGLGDVNAAASPTTVIGALKLISGGLGEAGPGAGTLVDSVLGALDQMRAGLTNPEFTEPQKELDGQTPKEYFADCPACFDPDSDRFDPATSDPAFQPSFLEVFNLFSEGIKAALPQLDSLDLKAPGLVDGLEQVVGGLDDLAAALHTFDPDDPGLVDGIELVRGGLQQVSTGIFALNELGIRTMRGQIGDTADSVGMDQGTLVDAATRAGSDSVLDADADVVSATYVFDLAAQSTASNDNLRRGALMGFALLGTALMTRRMRRFEL